MNRKIKNLQICGSCRSGGQQILGQQIANRQKAQKLLGLQIANPQIATHAEGPQM